MTSGPEEGSQAPHTSSGRGLKVAIVGGGMVGSVHHRAAIAAGACVAGVMSSSPSRSRELARRWGAPAWFESVSQLAESDVDVVHICTPNAVHAGLVHARSLWALTSLRRRP
jgi:predicted dehydrogenase